ncbi:MAG: hypothetical protein ACK4Z4_09970, partial [Ferrovibrio sp.]
LGAEMMRLNRGAVLHRYHVFLSALVILLGAVVIWRSTAPAAFPELPVVAVTEPGRGPAGMQASVLPVLSELSAAAERPLFNPNRKRAQVAPAAAQQQTAPVRPFRAPILLGIAGAGERRVALIKLPEDKEARRIRIGDSIEGWTVGEIGKDAVTFRNEAAEHEIRLRPSKENGGSATVRR